MTNVEVRDGGEWKVYKAATGQVVLELLDQTGSAWLRFTADEVEALRKALGEASAEPTP